MTWTSSNDLVERVTRVYERFASGDPQPMIEFLDEAVIYHLPGNHLGGGTVRGRLALFERTGKAAAACDAPPRIALLHVGAAGPLVVSLEHLTARRGARALDQTVCVVWRIAEGRCVEVWSHFADQRACDEFWEGVAF